MLTLVESLSASPAVQPGKAQTTPPPIPLQGDVRALAPGEVLFREGDARDHIYRVDSGALCLYRCNPDGTRTVLEFAFPGDLVGLGYLDNHISDAQATMETSLCCLSRTALDPGNGNSPRMRGRLTAAIEREVAFLKDSLAPSADQARWSASPRCSSRCRATTPTRVASRHDHGLAHVRCRRRLSEHERRSACRPLAEMEARGLIEPCAKGLRLMDLDALERRRRLTAPTA